MGEWSDYFEDFPEENPANYADPYQRISALPCYERISALVNQHAPALAALLEAPSMRAESNNIFMIYSKIVASLLHICLYHALTYTDQNQACQTAPVI